MLLEYYQVVVQHLKKWEKPAPKLVKKTEEKDLKKEEKSKEKVKQTQSDI